MSSRHSHPRWQSGPCHRRSCTSHQKEVMSSNQTTLIGQLAADPELRFWQTATPSRRSPSRTAVASSTRTRTSGLTRASRCSCVGRCGVSTPRTSRPPVQGDRVVVVGMLKQRSWGERRGREALRRRDGHRGDRPRPYAEAKAGQEPEAGRERRHTTPAGYGKSASDPWGMSRPAGAAERRTPF